MLASARPNHQPMRRNERIPTPSHPMKIWNILLAVTKVSMAIRKTKRYLKNWFMLGSACIYQVANSRMDQVT